MNPPKLLNDDEVREFITNGFLRLAPDVDDAVHSEIDELLRFSTEHESWLGNNIVSRIPRMHDVLRCPVVVGALTSLAGPGYYFHPHRAIHRSTPLENSDVELAVDVNGPAMGKGSNVGSGWHQDAQSPLSRARHHVPRYLIGFYFPHDTPVEMGPTRIQAGSYLYAHPVAPHAVVLPEQVKAGTFMLMHFDMVHAGFPNRTDQDRYMVKFVFTRTQPPTAPTWHNESAHWERPAACLPEYDLPETWSWIWNWMRGEPAVMDAGYNSTMAGLGDSDQVVRLRSTYGAATSQTPRQLADALRSFGGQDKHSRELAKDANGITQPRDAGSGSERRWNERAIVMEDATYALVAAGQPAIVECEALLTFDDPWVQLNAAFALGETGPSARNSVAKIAVLLRSPHQQVVRQALDAIGAIGCGMGPALADIERLMTTSNESWHEPQVGRGWHGEDQVRLNAAFALLCAVSSGEDLEKIESILTASLNDPNGYVGAVASETLVRLGTRTATNAAIQYLSDRRWDESLRARIKPF